MTETDAAELITGKVAVAKWGLMKYVPFPKFEGLESINDVIKQSAEDMDRVVGIPIEVILSEREWYLFFLKAKRLLVKRLCDVLKGEINEQTKI